MMLRRFGFVCLLFISRFAFGQSTQPITAQQQSGTTIWTIQTANSEYQIGLASDGVPIPLYYGPKGQPLPPASRFKVNPKIGSKTREVPFRGGFVDQTPAIEVVYADGTRDCDLVYDSADIAPIDGQPALAIHLKDPQYGLRVTAFYRVFPELDLMERWMTLSNVGDDAITVENAQSASIRLPPDEYDMTHLAGGWSDEFIQYTNRLTPGVQTMQVRDFSSFANPPWLAIRPADSGSESSGPVWFASLHYSGNWRFDVQKNPGGDVQIVGGINFWDTSLTLKPKEEFTTPKMVVGFAPDGMDGATHRLDDYICQHVLPARFRDRLRPVLYNSWYATEFNLKEDQQIELAKAAKELGVELFVVDDGWFKGRNDSHAGLGDWTPDPVKFPNGLGPMIKKINDLGMDFGIWVEPEMVNPNSDLYRAHPDWVFYYPKRERHEGRNQLMLNLAREDVYNYVLDSMTKLLKENNIKFIKWDRNRSLTEPGWPDAPANQQRSVRIRYIANLYKLIDELRSRFPDVMFEACSGGGGRPDIGMLDHMDQVWASDNTNPQDRLFIQSGFLRMLPPNTMVSWVTDQNSHDASISLKYRFNVAMSGVLGVGGNIIKWSDADRKIAAEKIAQYKQIREVVQHGSVYQLLLPQDGQRVALQYVSQDGAEAVVFLYNLREELAGSTSAERSTRTLHLRGLEVDAQYEMSGDQKGDFSGRTLMEAGIPWDVRGDYGSEILTLKRK